MDTSKGGRGQGEGGERRGLPQKSEKGGLVGPDGKGINQIKTNGVRKRKTMQKEKRVKNAKMDAPGTPLVASSKRP